MSQILKFRYWQMVMLLCLDSLYDKMILLLYLTKIKLFSLVKMRK